VNDWLIDAADLLGEPDPGPTPWLVEGLIVDQALTAGVGKWKTTKSWAMLEIGVSIATGTPAFGQAAIPEAGPVVYVIEESGKRALWRRLDALCRGRAIRPDELRDRLLLAPNQRVKLDEPEWQARLLEHGLKTRPRAFIFDPLARMKDSRREENEQTGMAPVIEFLRVLRDETGAAPLFVHHTGHQGDHMRGTSDLESVWESRLKFERDGESGIVTVKADHREEESGASIVYQLDWHHDTRTMRLRSTVPPLAERVIDYLRDHGPERSEVIAKAIETRRRDVDRTLATLEDAGTTHNGPSGRRDKTGRPIRDKVWHLNNQAALGLVPEPGRNGTSHPSAVWPAVPRPAPLGADEGRATATDARTVFDDPSFERGGEQPPPLGIDLSPPFPWLICRDIGGVGVAEACSARGTATRCCVGRGVAVRGRAGAVGWRRSRGSVSSAASGTCRRCGTSATARRCVRSGCGMRLDG
jgi:hypothetical protein